MTLCVAAWNVCVCARSAMRFDHDIHTHIRPIEMKTTQLTTLEAKRKN